MNQWSSSVVELCLGQLSKLGKPFKYIGMCCLSCWVVKQLLIALGFLKKSVFFPTVNCIIMQKNGAGLQTASSCFWDNSTDGKGNAIFIYTAFQMCGESSVNMFAWHQWYYFTTDWKMWRCYWIYYVFYPTGSCAVRWENKSTYCIVTVFGLAIWTCHSVLENMLHFVQNFLCLIIWICKYFIKHNYLKHCILCFIYMRQESSLHQEAQLNFSTLTNRTLQSR